jgi:hypothetical protein
VWPLPARLFNCGDRRASASFSFAEPTFKAQNYYGPLAEFGEAVSRDRVRSGSSYHTTRRVSLHGGRKKRMTPHAPLPTSGHRHQSPNSPAVRERAADPDSVGGGRRAPLPGGVGAAGARGTGTRRRPQPGPGATSDVPRASTPGRPPPSSKPRVGSTAEKLHELLRWRWLQPGRVGRGSRPRHRPPGKIARNPAAQRPRRPLPAPARPGRPAPREPTGLSPRAHTKTPLET